MRKLPILTNSEAKTFKRCAREHHIAYRLGIRARVAPEPLRFGTLLHRGLEAWWRGAMAKAPRETWLPAAFEATRNDAEDAFERIRAEELLRGYDARWGAEPLEVLGVEVEFSAHLVNPATGSESRTFELGGKIDAIVRMPTGEVFIVEHKGSGEDIGAGSDYWKRLRLDSQVSTYFVGGRALGYDVQGCLYDVIGKPKLQPLQATPEESRKYKKDGTLYANQRDRDEAPEEFRLRLRDALAEDPDRFYVRGVVTRLEEDERDAAFDLWQTARAIADAERLERFPRNDQSCVRWGRSCPYFAACTHETSLDDPERFRRVTKTHEELEAA